MRIRYGLVWVGIAALVLALVPAMVAAQVKVAAGTPVTVAFKQDVSSKHLKPGDEVPISLVEQLEVGGLVLVKAGAVGRAVVKSVEGAGKPGKPGKIAIELVGIDPDGNYKAMNDKVLTLQAEGGKIEAKGKGKKILSFLFIFGLFIKGGEATIPADQPFKATVKEDIFIIPNE